MCLTLCDPMDYTVHGILHARILEWVVFPFSRGSSQPRDQTQVSSIAGRFFTSWATREAQEYWSGYPIPSSEDLPDPGIEPDTPALQADSLLSQLPGKTVEEKKGTFMVPGLVGSTALVILIAYSEQCWICDFRRISFWSRTSLDHSRAFV